MIYYINYIYYIKSYLHKIAKRATASAEAKDVKDKDSIIKELQDQIPVIKEQLDKEMKDRNYFQLESVSILIII